MAVFSNTETALTETVTIVMPSFNAERTIQRAIDSVVAQTHHDWTLICVDDASRDATTEILAGYRSQLGRRLSVHGLAENKGPARARNLGLSHATGAWVALLDADDAWRPERLATMLRLGRDADLVCDNLLGFDDHSGRETGPLFQSLPAALDICTVVAAEYQGRYNLGYLKPLVRRAFLDRHGIVYDAALRTGEDLLFLLTCLARGPRTACTSEPGYIYTTPVGHGSGRLSRSTFTIPRDAELAAALKHFLDDHARTFSARDRSGIEQRIAYLDEIAPLAKFRHARLSHDWVATLRLLITAPQVRRRIWSALGGKRARAPGSWI